MILTMRVVAAFLLVTYIPVFILSPVVFTHSDHDHAAHQIDTCEKDPCHISIYHPGHGGGCSHKYHLTEAPEKCPWCDVILAYQVEAQQIQFYFHEIEFSSVASDIFQSADLLVPFCHSGRGPPLHFI